MKIIHVDFVGPYTEGMSYQENILPACQVRKENEVLFFAPCIKWENAKIVKTEQVEKIMENGVKLVRFPYVNLPINILTRAFRPVKGIYRRLCEEKPDVIMLHGAQTFVTMAVCKYKKKYPQVRVVVDDHSDYNNSATNFFTRYLLHRTIYRCLAKMVENVADIYYYITPETKNFLMKEYGISKEKLRLLPLGGICFSDEIYNEKRSRKREELGLSEDRVLVIHSGKLGPGKKTRELIEGFSKLEYKNITLAIIGQAEGEIQSYIESVVRSDARITFLGWKSGSELQEYLCAADIYAQPGTQSATLQNAICCRCAVMVHPYPSHEILVKGNGCYVSDADEITEALKKMVSGEVLKEMSGASQQLGQELLDYNMLAKRVIEEKL